jgi:hypothetical protein
VTSEQARQSGAGQPFLRTGPSAPPVPRYFFLWKNAIAAQRIPTDYVPNLIEAPEYGMMKFVFGS